MACERSGEQAAHAEGPVWLAAAAALAWVLVAVLALIFDVAREAPPDYGCEGAPHGQAALLTAYRDGSVTWHAIAILWCLATLVAISIERSTRRGLQAVGLPTFFAVGLAGIALALALGSEFGVLLALPAMLIALPGIVVARPDGPVGVALLGVLLLLGAAAFNWVGVRERHLALVAAGLWWLAWFAAGHLVFVQTSGDGPLLC